MAEMGYFNMAEQVVKEAVEVANATSAQAAVALDTMLQLQKEKDSEHLALIERMEQRHAEETADIRKHYQKIIISMALAFILFLGSIVGAVVYLVSNFDFEFLPSYSIDVSAEGGGDATNEDGIHVNDWREPQE